MREHFSREGRSGNCRCSSDLNGQTDHEATTIGEGAMPRRGIESLDAERNIVDNELR